jgi:hypothetical protein
MTEAEHVKLLRAIRDLALLGYPYPDGAPPVAAEYLLALGQIARIVDDALARFGEGQSSSAPSSAPSGGA